MESSPPQAAMKARHDRRDFSDVVADRCLPCDPVTKAVAVVGKVKGLQGDALIVATPQTMESREDITAFLEQVSLENALSNDAYSTYVGSATAKYHVTMTHPATPKHIQKFERQPYYRIEETADMYQLTVVPYIHSIPESRTQWVRNILDKVSEAERIVLDDPDPQLGFILLPDFKWNGTHMTSLYLQAIARDASIRSLRDLSGKHLSLLENIRDKTYAIIEERYGVDRRLMRSFIHYHPSYYHFHVHFVHSDLVTANCSVGKAHLLEDVIENIRHRDTYYQERTIVHYLPQSHDLVALLIPGQLPNISVE
ncbi:Scavenger mRNA-decapping enzyme DcpS [Plasmodiophora brassicae]|uniref:m7GpppX diphosphatase n=1 Tax=Plasmodiophora brassicae TaxID=37360 RepID=A0A3P3YLM3_PLABS|nr:unnamed protein product [Plasmodiophora brassicae]